MQYGVQAPFGLQPVRTIQGNPFNGQTNTYVITNNGSATTVGLFLGDPVIMTAAGTISQYPNASGTNAWLGVFSGCTYTDANNIPQFVGYIPNGTTFAGNTLPIAKVIDDPYVIYQIQADNSTAIGTPQAIIGQNAQLVNADGANLGNLPIGQSAFALHGASIATGNSNYPLTILRFVPTPDMNLNSSYVCLEVLPNNHFYGSQRSGI